MNNIPQRQNEQQAIDKLKAQRHKYTIAKRYGDANFVCCIVIVLAFAILKLIFPQEEWLVKSAVCYGAVVTIVKVFLTRKQLELKKDAARIQQMFDCYLFNLSWNRALCGKQLEPEDICEAAEGEPEEGLTDWYNPKVGNLTPSSATLACMRINVTYDRKLKQKYLWLIHFVYAAMLLLCIWPVFTDFTFRSVFLKVFVPILPLVLYYIDIIHKMKNNITVLEEINNSIKDGIEKRKEGTDVSTEELAQIQDLIFLYRTNSFTIPNWFYNLKRNKMEATIDYGIDQLCSEIH